MPYVIITRYMWVDAENIYFVLKFDKQYALLCLFSRTTVLNMFFFLPVAQIYIGLTIILLGHVTGTFLMQRGCFIMLFSVSMVNEILHLHYCSLKYIAILVVILPAIIVPETLCIHSIIDITTRIELGMRTESKLNEYYEDATLAMSINAAML